MLRTQTRNSFLPKDMRPTPPRRSPHLHLHKLASLLLAAVLLITAACSQRRNTVLVLWHTLDGAREQALLRFIDQYNAANTNGSFIVPERKTLAAQHNALLRSRTGAALPALLLVQPMQAAIYNQQALLAPFDRFIADLSAGWSPMDLDDLFPFVMQAGRTVQGNVIGLPMGGRTRILFYNQDRVSQLGVETNLASHSFSWQSFTDVCSQVTDRTRGNFCFSVPVDYQSLADWALANGGRMVSADNTQLQVSDPRTIGAMTQLLRYLQAGQAYPSPSTAEAQQQLALGQSTFAFGWTDEIASYQSAIRNGENFDWSVAALPQASADVTATATSATLPLSGAVSFEAPLWVIPSSNPTQENLAWSFVKWLLDAPQTTAWARLTGDLPARRSAVPQLAATPSNEDTAAAVAAFAIAVSVTAPIAQPLPLVGGWRCAQDSITTGLREIFENRPLTDTLQNVQISAQPELVLDCTLR